MQRKLFSLVVVLSMLLTLVLTAPFAAGEVVEISFWHSMSDTAGVLLDGFVQEFNETRGKELGVRVTAAFQGKYSDAVTKMNGVLSAEAYEELPDVMNLDATGKVGYMASGVAYTVDDALRDHPEDDLSALLPAAMGNWQLAGTQLGLPFATSTTVTFYNKTMLSAAGAKAPETLADIAALRAALPDKTASGADVIVYAAIPNTPTLANWLGQMGSYLVDNANGADGAASALACVDNGTLTAFLTEWKALYASGALSVSNGGSDLFASGRLAVYTTSSSNVNAVLQKVGGAFEVGVALYPKVNADAAFGATVSGSCLCIFDKGSDARKEAAWEFARYLTSPDVQAAFCAGTGYTPANTLARETETYKALLADYPQYAVAIEQLALTPPEMRSVTVGPSIDFYYAIGDITTEMLEDDWTVAETVEALSDELGGLLTRYLQANP